MTPAELTALLAPVRAELDACEENAVAAEGDSDAYSAVLNVLTRVRAALDKLTPPATAELDPMVVLGIAALGMLRELRTSGRVATTWTAEHDGSVDAAKRTVVDWNERADALLAAAYPEPPLVRVLGSPDAEYQQRPVDNWPKAAQAVGRPSPREQQHGECRKCGTRHGYHVSRYQPPVEVTCSTCGHSWTI
jgi:ribosomal protein L37E